MVVKVLLYMLPIAVGLFVAWWFAFRPIRLRSMYRVTPLLAPSAPGGLEVAYGGQPVRNPHLLEVTLANESRRDIGVSAFSGGHLRFTFGQAEFITLLEADEGETLPDLRGVQKADTGGRVPDQFEVEFPPHLLKGKASSSIGILCEGEPRHTASAVKLENVSLHAPMGMKRKLGLVAVGLGAVLGTAYLLNQDILGSPVAALGSTALGLVMGTIGVIEGRDGMRQELMTGGAAAWRSM